VCLVGFSYFAFFFWFVGGFGFLGCGVCGWGCGVVLFFCVVWCLFGFVGGGCLFFFFFFVVGCVCGLFDPQMYSPSSLFLRVLLLLATPPS